MSKLTLRDLDVRGKRVLVRVDFNVPTEERNGEIVITDDTRIRESLPTINYLREHWAKTFLMEKELKYLQEELAHPARPFLVILGGAKVSDKIGVIKALMEKADAILIGGAMANTFLAAQGIPVGNSRIEADKLDLARELLSLAQKKGVRFLPPMDLLGAEEIKSGAATRDTGHLSPTYGVPDGWLGVDIGSLTIGLFKG